MINLLMELSYINCQVQAGSVSLFDCSDTDFIWGTLLFEPSRNNHLFWFWVYTV